MSELKLVPRNEVEEQYTWDMKMLYPSDAAFREDLKVFDQEIESFRRTNEGKIKDVDSLDRAISQLEHLLDRRSHISHYAELPMTVDRFNPSVVENMTLFEAVASAFAIKTSFFEAELMELSTDILDRFVQEKRQDLSYYIEKMKRKKKHHLGLAAEKMIAGYESLPLPIQLYETAKFEDMSFDSFSALGKTFENSYVLYENIYEMDPIKEIRRGAAQSFYKTLKQYKNITANIYIAQLKREKMLATARGYDSVIDYLLDEQDGSRDLYNRQIQVLMKDLAPHIRRYIRLLAREHRIDDMQFMDCKINLDPSFEVDMTIEESKEYLTKALAVLGQEYVQTVRESYDKRWTDFPKNEGKSTGGFCTTVKGVGSFILLSWTGKMNEVFVLAHELGHALHFTLAGEHQSALNFDCPLYFVEAPSTCNEVIVSNYLLKTSEDLRFKRWVISNMISRTYFHNMVTHYLEAVYQDRVYKKIDNNEFLSADILSQIKREVMEEFFGDSLVVNEGAELTWMRQPHYYMGLYPYTYSAGLTIGTTLANRFETSKEAVDAWLETLKQGSSMSSLGLSRLAGCDVSTEQPLQETIAYIGHLVDELYRLTDEITKA